VANDQKLADVQGVLRGIVPEFDPRPTLGS
jgi:hypothetical protein